jgi:hypothetical protein
MTEHQRLVAALRRIDELTESSALLRGDIVALKEKLAALRNRTVSEELARDKPSSLKGTWAMNRSRD